ncbi:YunC family protein [bacterium]|nr:YunC family protein [bacterium]
MKRLLLLILLALPILTLAEDTPFDWSGLERSKISLEAPLLIVKGSLGFLGCGYINVDACTDEACAIVSGVNTHNDMLEATIKAVSKDATKLGIKVGMTGAEAIELFR